VGFGQISLGSGLHTKKQLRRKNQMELDPKERIQWQKRPIETIAPGELVDWYGAPQIWQGIKESRFGRIQSTENAITLMSPRRRFLRVGLGEAAARAAKAIVMRIPARNCQIWEKFPRIQAQLLLGSDPEFFLGTSEKKVIPAYKILPDKKENKNIYWDAFASAVVLHGTCHIFIECLDTSDIQLLQREAYSCKPSGSTQRRTRKC
jgi:hypothetical protein